MEEYKTAENFGINIMRFCDSYSSLVSDAVIEMAILGDFYLREWISNNDWFKSWHAQEIITFNERYYGHKYDDTVPKYDN